MRDLNLETTTITLLTLYSTQKPIHDTVLVIITIVININSHNVGHINIKIPCYEV